MRNSELTVPKIETRTIDRDRVFSGGTWRQTLQISRIGSTVYFDEGNGAFVKKGATVP
jgi:hypothetical protein